MTGGDKLDLKKSLKAHYSAKADPGLVDIADVRYLMIDGSGDPATSQEYADAVATLYGAAYTIKFREKSAGRDFVVPPLEGLWWADDMEVFRSGDRGSWEWTAMIAMPDTVPDSVVEGSIAGIASGDDVPPAIGLLRLEMLSEGRSAQVLHIGPYSEEAPTIERLHDFIAEQGLERRGRHHEIYLSDPRRTAPEKLKTIIRQPV